MLQAMFASEIGCILLVCDTHFIEVVVLQQLPDILFVEPILNRLRKDEIEHELVVQLQFDHVVVYLTENLVQLGISY